MRKKMFLIPVILLLMSACGNTQVGTTENQTKVENSKEESEESAKKQDTLEDKKAVENTEKIKKDFGTFNIPDGWAEAKEQSGHGRYFYVLKGHEHDAMPNNISINMGHQNYNLDESEKFAESTMMQLSMQIKQYGANATVSGSSGTTDAGDIMYIFDIKFNDSDEIDRQYYILRDKKFVMVFMTNFDNNDEVNKAAELMAKSFEWK